MREATTSSMVPGAHIEVAFQKIHLDATRFLKGDDLGYFAMENPLSESNLPDVLEALYKLQEEDATDETIEISNALIENLTTKNDLTNEELSWLYSIARQGGTAELTKVLEATPGMSKALGKIKFKGQCSDCDFKVPKYSGRYPKFCPECGKPLQMKESVDLTEAARTLDQKTAKKLHKQYLENEDVNDHTENYLMLAKAYGTPDEVRRVASILKRRDAPGSMGVSSADSSWLYKNINPYYKLLVRDATKMKESFSLQDAPPSHRVGEVESALRILAERLRLIHSCGLNESTATKVVRLPEEATGLQKAFVNDEALDDVSAEDIFESLVLYLMESSDTKYDRLVGVLFEKYPLEGNPNLVTTLREEVGKRAALVKSISSLQEMGSLEENHEERPYFVLNKALSSCFTRVMIQGETRGGEHFKFLGKHIFEMMQRAFDGNLQGPARFLNTYFLRG